MLDCTLSKFVFGRFGTDHVCCPQSAVVRGTAHLDTAAQRVGRNLELGRASRARAVSAVGRRPHIIGLELVREPDAKGGRPRHPARVRARELICRLSFGDGVRIRS